MFSVMSVILPTGGSHVTIIHDALDLTVQGSHEPALPFSPHQSWEPPDPSPGCSDIRPETSCAPAPTPVLVTSGVDHWRPVQTCLCGGGRGAGSEWN